MSNHLVSGPLGAADPDRLFVETADGAKLTYGDSAGLAGRFANAFRVEPPLPGVSVRVTDRETGAPLTPAKPA